MEHFTDKVDKMNSLLAICFALCPRGLEESVQRDLKEKYADKIQKMQRGSAKEPKYISYIYLIYCLFVRSFNFIIIILFIFLEIFILQFFLFLFFSILFFNFIFFHFYYFSFYFFNSLFLIFQFF